MNNSSFRILSFGVNGIKNISSPISIQFFNNIIRPSDFDKSGVKIVYGPNGAGKTAIVTALDFYRKVVCDPNALSDGDFNHRFGVLTNRQADSIFFDVVFAFKLLGGKLLKVRHIIEFGIDEESGSVYIVKESIAKLDARNGASSLFEVQNNQLVKTIYPVFEELFLNRLDNVSIVAKTVALFPEFEKKNIKLKGDATCLVLTFFFASSLYIYYGSDDSVLYRPYILPQPTDPANAQEVAKEIQTIDKNRDKRYLASVRYEDFESYSEHIECVKRFVQLFKPELERIDIDKRDLDKKYWINLTFVYKDGSRVDFENESTGIKKIVTLSNALEALTRGGIVIIDETDSGIMDKIISEVVSYAINFTSGQLLLTTHHVGLMDVVKKKKHSIDFLSTDNILTKWTNNGNYSPDRVYNHGGVPHIPLNISSLDFIEVFNGDADD